MGMCPWNNILVSLINCFLLGLHDIHTVLFLVILLEIFGKILLKMSIATGFKAVFWTQKIIFAPLVTI